MQRENLYEWIPPSFVESPRQDAVELLFSPALKRAAVYKRAVGYFSSAWIAQNATGLANMAIRGGQAYWITSPHLSEPDWEAMIRGSEGTDAVIERSLLSSIDELEEALEVDTLNTLAWMISDGLAHFRIAVPKDLKNNRDFHTKFGIFADQDGPQVGFLGSMNESARGLVNHELLTVYHKNRPGESHRVDELDRLFQALWNDKSSDFKVLTLPDVALKKLIQFRRTPRPYPQPDLPTPTFRAMLRDYQFSALNAWRDNDNCGIFEMATGTGKTITAIACIEERLLSNDPPKIVLVACPFQHLVDQWVDELKALKIPVVSAYQSSAVWSPQLKDIVLELEAGSLGSAIVVTTYTTLAAERLSSNLAPIKDAVFFVADECHYLGSQKHKIGMHSYFRERLGLSATPERHYDEDGTNEIVSFFNGIVFEFGLERAIQEGHLTPYSYHPEIVELNEDESEEYLKLTEQLSRLWTSEDEPNEAARFIAMKRAKVLNNAESKLAWLAKHLLAEPAENWRYTLVYADDRIFKQVTKLIGIDLGIRQHEFTFRQNSKQRAVLLDRFAAGEVGVLTAMRCLDEGVDIPPTRTAFFLASSGNPREFVQRRGRILRNAPGKVQARIIDAIALPSLDSLAYRHGSKEWQAIRAALRSQLRRIQEFAQLATNYMEASEAIFELRLRYDLPEVVVTGVEHNEEQI